MKTQSGHFVDAYRLRGKHLSAWPYLRIRDKEYHKSYLLSDCIFVGNHSNDWCTALGFSAIDGYT